MRIEALFVDRFRSIDHLEINECGPLNVLIGKNNSGKSNILSAIDAFFRVLREGELLTIRSPVNQIVDFHNQDTSSPVSVTVRFVLDDQLVSELLSNVVREAPQMRNVIDTLSSYSRLSVTVKFIAPPKSFAYISAISLSDNVTPPGSGERALLAVEEQTADELYQRASRADELSKDSKALTSLPERFPAEYLRRTSEQRVPTRFLLRGQ